MTRPRRSSGAWMALLGLVAGSVALASPVEPAHDARAVDTATVVQQFLSRDDAPLEQYQGRRIMRARNARFNKEAWLEAATMLDHASGFTYEVVASGGSPMIVNRVLLPALRGEADMWRTREPERYSLTPENYEFVDASTSDAALDEIRVAVAPRRKHVLLVTGALYLSARDADLLRVAGRLSKSPSFWVSRVEVVRRYARLGGIRVPVELESTAHVRLAGPSVMQIAYLYDSINGRPVPGR